jgi:hypothetical protein
MSSPDLVDRVARLERRVDNIKEDLTVISDTVVSIDGKVDDLQNEQRKQGLLLDKQGLLLERIAAHLGLD